MNKVSFNSRERSKILSIGLFPFFLLFVLAGFLDKNIPEFITALLFILSLFVLLYSIYFSYRKYDVDKLPELIYKLNNKNKIITKVCLYLSPFLIMTILLPFILNYSTHTLDEQGGQLIKSIYLISIFIPIIAFLAEISIFFILWLIKIKVNIFFVSKFLLKKIELSPNIKTVQAYSEGFANSETRDTTLDKKILLYKLLHAIWILSTLIFVLITALFIFSIIKGISSGEHGGSLVAILALPVFFIIGLIYYLFTIYLQKFKKDIELR